MKLGYYYKTAAERKRYSIDYFDWLDTDETLASMVFTVAPSGDLEIDAYSIATEGSSVVFIANAGTDATVYTVNVKATTSGGQIKEDEVTIEVKDL